MTSRQWNKSSTKLISGIISVAVVATGIYWGYKKLWPKKVEKKRYKFKRRTDGRKNLANRPMYQRTNEPNPNACYQSDDGYTIKWGDTDGVHQFNYNNGKKGDIPQRVLDRVRVKQRWWAFWKLG